MITRMGIGLLAGLFFCAGAMAVDFGSRAYSCPTSHTVLASGFQRFARLKNRDSDVATRFNPAAGAIGYVYSPGDWYAGAAVSWEYGTRKYGFRDLNGGARIRSNMPGVSLYGGMEFPEGWYADGGAFLGFGDYHAKNAHINQGQFGSGTTRHEEVFAANLEFGKKFDLGGTFLLTPHAGLDYAYTPGEKFSWGDGAFAFSSRSQNYVEIPLGVSVSAPFDYGKWRITPKIDVTMVNSIGKMDAMNTAPGFAYYTPKGWRVAGIGGDHIGARLTAGVKANMSDRTSLGLDYTYEGRESYNDHRISAMFGLSF